MVRATLGGQVKPQGISEGFVMRGAGVCDAFLISEEVTSGMLTASCQDDLAKLFFLSAYVTNRLERWGDMTGILSWIVFPNNEVCG
jgi:hypothetical protein